MPDFPASPTAARLHQDAFVFDYVPLGEPVIMTARHQRVMEDQLERGSSVGNVLRRMFADRISELREVPQTRKFVQDTWRASGVDAIQATMGGIEIAPSSWDATLRDIAHWHERSRISEDVAICTTAKELLAAKAANRIGVMLGTQDAAQFEKDLGRVDIVRGLGVRIVQLTYNSRNYIGDGCTEPEQAGLSRFGRAFVRHLDELGLVTDVSHSGYRTTLDAIAHSARPVAITHSCCQAVTDHPRAKSDEQLRLLREKEGYLGIVAVPSFLKQGGKATLHDLLRHVGHAVSIMGVTRVGIATDWGGWTPDMPPALVEATRREFVKLGFQRSELPAEGDSIQEFTNWTDWPRITAALLGEGYTEAEVRGLIGGNWLAFLERH